MQYQRIENPSQNEVRLQVMKVGEIYLIDKIQFVVYHLKLHFNMKRLVLILLKSNEK